MERLLLSLTMLAVPLCACATGSGTPTAVTFATAEVVKPVSVSGR